MARAIDLFGIRFGRLVAIRRVGSASDGSAMWLCACACGREVTQRASRLRCGEKTSCGCRRGSLWRVHGRRRAPDEKPWHKTPTYRSWRNMITRCSATKGNAFKYYSSRGITVCSRWIESFDNFLADLGERPSGMSLDRIDTNGNYEPNNCRWATQKMQLANRRKYQKRKVN